MNKVEPVNINTEEYNEYLTEIGGYFGLDLPDYGDLYTDAIKYQSGRAAIRAALECNGITHAFIPAYICDSIIKSAVDAGVKVETYDLDEFLYPKQLPRIISSKCVVIYVNYFGLCQNNISRLLEEIPEDQVIIDNSHALYAPETGALATIYSPRKFVGLPDGGLLRASPLLQIRPPTREDIGSFDRMRHLLIRMAYSAREGYVYFDKARQSLNNNYPLAMSGLTKRLMKSIQWNCVAERRRENYNTMSSLLNSLNEYQWDLGENDVPLCYPFTARGQDVRNIKIDLAKKNIFIATYWPDALPRITPKNIEDILINETLFLPIDQRMTCSQVEEVSEQILKTLRN